MFRYLFLYCPIESLHVPVLVRRARMYASMVYSASGNKVREELSEFRSVIRLHHSYLEIKVSHCLPHKADTCTCIRFLREHGEAVSGIEINGRIDIGSPIILVHEVDGIHFN